MQIEGWNSLHPAKGHGSVCYVIVRAIQTAPAPVPNPSQEAFQMARTGSTTSTTRRSRAKATDEAATEQITENPEAATAEVSTTTDEAQEGTEMSIDTVEADAQADAVADEAATAQTEASDTTEVDEAAVAAENKFVEFQAVVQTALDAKDETTGTVPEVNLEAVKTAYRELAGAKYKGKAKTFLNEKLKEIVNAHDIITAQAAMACIDAIEHAGPSKRETTKREPSDPAEAFRDRLTVAHLAYALVRADVPEGVDADEQYGLVEAKVGELMSQAESLFAWTQSTADDKGDEPEVDGLVKRAVKAAQGKAATAPRKTATGATRTPHSGGNRNVRTHIAQAFENDPSGTEKRINAVAKTVTAEYPEGDCSPGAISAAFDSQRGVEGFEMTKDDKGVKTVRKL
jgi:hypothetical protein